MFIQTLILLNINISNEHISVKPYTDVDFNALNNYFDKSMLEWFIKDYECFADFINDKLVQKSLGKLIPLTIYGKNGEALGLTCIYEIDAQHKSVEVGATWLAKRYQGTGYNLIFKYYLFKTLIEDFKLNRIQLKADAENLRSVAAMKSIGLNYEGKLLSNKVVKDSRVRDTEMFSITQNTWLDIKTFMLDKLDQKFAGLKW